MFTEGSRLVYVLTNSILEINPTGQIEGQSDTRLDVKEICFAFCHLIALAVNVDASFYF
jgi:hypothetical protein